MFFTNFSLHAAIQARTLAAPRLYATHSIPFSPALVRAAAKLRAPVEQPAGIFNFASGATYSAWSCACTCRTHRRQHRPCIHSAAVWLFYGLWPIPLDPDICGPAPIPTAAYVRVSPFGRPAWYRIVSTNSAANWAVLADIRTGDEFFHPLDDAAAAPMRVFYKKGGLA